MYKRMTIIIPMVLFFLLFNLQFITCANTKQNGACNAQTTLSPTFAGQNNNMETARKLRIEGEELQKKGQLAAAVDKYEQSQIYYPDSKLSDHIRMLRDTLTKQYIEAAKKLRGEGEALQNQGKLEAAIEKYELSQKYYVDSGLERHISRLQDALSLSKKPKFELNEAPEGFKDELAMIEKLRNEPTRANMNQLAVMRYQYALTLTKGSVKKNDEDTRNLAFFYAKSATELSPNNPNYWVLLGQLYDKSGDSELAGIMAEDALQKAVELKSDDLTFHLLLGQLYFRRDHYSSALEQFETVLKKDPKFVSPSVVATMCSAYVLDAQYLRGVNFFRDILEKQSNADSARLALAMLFRRQKDIRQATEELNRIIKRPGASEENRIYAAKLLEDWQKEGVKP